jgi:MFS family permease
MAAPTVTIEPLSWYSELDASHWHVLTGSFLGWIFDGYESYALVLVMTPALRQLLAPADLPNLSRYAGFLVAITLLGWAAGGVLGGIVSDYLGRKRTMMVTIFLYAIFTGLTAFVHTWPQMAFFRFLTGLGLGGEWATGATLIAESWPARARAKGQGIMQSAFGWGSLLAAGAWYYLGPLGGPSAWRLLFLVGVIPAFFVLYIRRHVRESDRWLERHRERKLLRRRRRSGAGLSSEEAAAADFTVAVLFRSPQLRRLVLLCMMMSLATTLGYWAVSSWIPAYAESVSTAASAGDPARWAALAGVLYNVGAIVGYLAAGLLADVIGRRPLLLCFFGGSLLTTPLVYRWTHTPATLVAAAAVNGMFTLGQFAWMAIYPPELFPTALRCTAVSLIFNTARFISCFGPLLAGFLITRLGGYSATALLLSLIYLVGLCAVPFLPETKGEPLPE